MSTNPPELFIFTEASLRERDLKLATRVHQLSVASTVRKTNRMKPGQVLNASRKNGESLYWSSEKIESVLDHIFDDE